MEQTEVIIVGAGPSGLAMALSLAKFRIKSVILEKESDITQDPRGVYLTHDAVRILWDIGIGEEAKNFGHEPAQINFHTSYLEKAPFFKLDMESDWAEQAVPNAILQIQPRLELALRNKVNETTFSDLRCGCRVISREATADGVSVAYIDQDGLSQSIQGSWLIGADGKKGTVRKEFLENSAGIEQVDGPYKYDGTWVAANVKLTLPTPASHPEFPLWELGYSSEDVYDLFWPKGWHFCSPPGKATAAGRFGPYEERLWRHEFEQDNWDDTFDAEKLLWEQLKIMTTRQRDAQFRLLPCGEVKYPLDCVEVRRCRAFRFAHKVVNKWFDDRTILIGDAAHVFPPFGGQGIVSGLRDAHQLSWRLFLLERLPQVSRALREDVLSIWARERSRGVRDAAFATRMNGRLCNEGDSWAFWLSRTILWISRALPFVPSPPHPFLVAEKNGYMRVEDGFFLKPFGGGSRIAQTYIATQGLPPTLSDNVLHHGSALTLLVVNETATELVSQAKAAVRGIGLHKVVLSEDSVKALSFKDSLTDCDEYGVAMPSSSNHFIGHANEERCNASGFLARLRPTTKFTLVRADFHIFAQASNVEELVECLRQLKTRLSES